VRANKSLIILLFVTVAQFSFSLQTLLNQENFEKWAFVGFKDFFLVESKVLRRDLFRELTVRPQSSGEHSSFLLGVLPILGDTPSQDFHICLWPMQGSHVSSSLEFPEIFFLFYY
jgi:hypothetical protein